MNKKKKRWSKPRHRIVRNIAYLLLYPYAIFKYNIKIEPFKEQKKIPYLILLNHQTPFDQFFVGMSFKGPVYYLASEDLFSNGFISSLIRWLVAPIPIRKQTTDVAAVMNCMRVAKEGCTIAIAPEGNRTYSGKTEYMNPAIAHLAKKLKLPVALFRIEGGYGAEPRWSDVVRKGKMKAYVSRVVEPEEYSKLSDDEFLALIEKELFVDEGVADGIFKSNKRAEYLERAMYVCPFCSLSEFESRGNEITCKKCGRKIIYGEDKRLRGVGFDFPFEFVTQWYDSQKEFICSLDTTQYTETPMYKDLANISQVNVYKNKKLLRKMSEICLYGDKITVDENKENSILFPFSELSAVTVLGRNKLNIYCKDKIYQLKGSKRFNALKYVNIYFRHKSILRGEENGKFLGL